MFRKLGLLAVVIAVPGTAGAFELGTEAGATFDAFAVPRVAVHFNNDPSSDETHYGHGGGFRATGKVWGPIGVIAEYQNHQDTTIEIDGFTGESNGVAEEFRLGGGWRHISGSGVFAEYVQLHGTGSTIDGFGLRGRFAFKPGLEGLSLFTEVGMARTEPTRNDPFDTKLKHLQMSFGGTAAISGPWSLFAEFRRTRINTDVAGDNSIARQEDFRIGVRANLDY